MELPNVTSDPEQYYSIDAALANNLDKDGLLRLKAVEQAVKFFKNKNVPSIEQLDKKIESIYNFLNKKENGTTT
jgi:hypothetical protein